MAFGLAQRDGRACLVLGEGVADVERASGGRFGPDPMACLAAWEAFRAWAGGLGPGAAEEPLDATRLGPPVPRPRQVFGVGLNYREHAREAGLDIPTQPMLFAKFPTCLAGPRSAVRLTSDRVDWEAELVVVLGAAAGPDRPLAEADALDGVAGYCVGQDVSDRRRQFADKPPQFSVGKSAPGFGPTGPAVVPLDGLADPLDLAVRCDVSGERMQDARTADMIFAVPELLAWLSRHVALEPGDLVFTGTPAGVGSVRDPRRYLRDGDVVETTIEGLGSLVNRFSGP